VTIDHDGFSGKQILVPWGPSSLVGELEDVGGFFRENPAPAAGVAS
jgi:hypothetical protein